MGRSSATQTRIRLKLEWATARTGGASGSAGSWASEWAARRSARKLAGPVRDVVRGLPVRAADARRVHLPGPPPDGVALVDLGVGEALPGAVVHLGEARVGLDPDGRAQPGRDDLGRLLGADERTGDDPLERDPLDARRERAGLGPAGVRELDVDALAEVLLRRRPRGEPVAGKHESQHGRRTSVSGRRASVGCRAEVNEPDERRALSRTPRSCRSDPARPRPRGRTRRRLARPWRERSRPVRRRDVDIRHRSGSCSGSSSGPHSRSRRRRSDPFLGGVMRDTWRTFRASVAAILVSAGLLTELAGPAPERGRVLVRHQLAQRIRQVPGCRRLQRDRSVRRDPVGLQVAVDRWFLGRGHRARRSSRSGVFRDPR